MEDVIKFISPNVGKGATPFPGTLTDPREAALTNQLTTAIQGAGPAINRLLSGEVPEEFFESTIKNPLLKALNEEIIPIAEEGLPDQGLLFAQPRFDLRRRIVANAFDTLASERGKLAQTAFEAPGRVLPAIASGIGVAAQLAQQNVERNVAEFIRTQPEYSPFLELAFSALGISQRAVGTAGSSQFGPVMGKSSTTSMSGGFSFF